MSETRQVPGARHPRGPRGTRGDQAKLDPSVCGDNVGKWPLGWSRRRSVVGGQDQRRGGGRSQDQLLEK